MFSPVCRRVTKMLVHTSGQSVERALLTVSQGRRMWWGSMWDLGTTMQTPGSLQMGAVTNTPCTAIQVQRETCTEMLAYFGKSWELFFFCLDNLYNVKFLVISNPIIIGHPDNLDNFLSGVISHSFSLSPYYDSLQQMGTRETRKFNAFHVRHVYCCRTIATESY